MKNPTFFFLTIAILFFGCSTSQNDKELPNILWIVSEDNSPFIGAYGDSLAITPNIDQLANEGMLYTNAFSNAPVCAPARHTIITGTYPNGNGTEHMRSEYQIDSVIKFFPQYLRELGYYTTNRRKKDYNTTDQKEAWDESSKTAYYSNREEAQPFFHVVNFTRSHESSIHGKRPEVLVHNPSQMNLPPYHPDTEEIRKDWAWYYDRITQMDTLVGNVIDDLKKDGLYEDTIIFYYSDHGGVLARSKRYLYDSGQRVPFIVHVPDKYEHLYPDYKPASKNDRLVSFVDLAPTILSLVGEQPKSYHDGKAFNSIEEKRNYVYGFSGRFDAKIDMSRSVRDQDFLYVRHFRPELPFGVDNQYQFRQATMHSWLEAYKNGECNNIQKAFWEPKPIVELFDCSKDPHNVYNLANSDEYLQKRQELDMKLIQWMVKERDKGIIHELERVTLDQRLEIDTWSDTRYEDLLEFAIGVSENSITIEEVYQALLKDEHYQNWALHFLLKNNITIEENGNGALEKLLTSKATSVQIQAAVLLLKTSENPLAIEIIANNLQSAEDLIQLYTLEPLRNLSIQKQKWFEQQIKTIADSKNKEAYNVRKATTLISGWK